MSVSKEVNSAIGTLADTRVYPSIVPSDVKLPFLVWSRIPSATEYSLNNVRQLTAARIEVTAWSQNFDEAEQLSTDAEALFEAYTSPTVQVVQVSDRFTVADVDNALFGHTLAVVMWTTED